MSGAEARRRPCFEFLSVATGWRQRNRNNFLFVGNDVAGQNLAVLLSLVRTCEAVGVNPQAYLADVLMRVQDWPAAKVAELLPECWAAA